MALLAFFKTSLTFLLYQFQNWLDAWIYLCLSKSNDTYFESSNTVIPLHMGNIFFINCSFYLYSCDRILHKFRYRPFIFKAPNSFKKFTTILKWIPYSFCTVILQCSVLLLLLYVAQFINLPYYSSFIIVCSTSMIIVMQAIKNGFLS